MQIVVALVFTFLFAGTAAAQLGPQIVKLTGNTVFMAIQCDVGRFGVVAKKSGIDPAMKAHVVYTYDVEQSQKVALSAGATIVKWIVEGPKVEASRTWSHTDERTWDGAFNINQENRAACGAKSRPRVPVGIYDCLVSSTMPIKAGVIAKCKKTVVAAGKLTASGKIKWLIFEAGPEGDFDAKVTYTINIDAPVKEDKAKEEKKVSLRP